MRCSSSNRTGAFIARSPGPAPTSCSIRAPVLSLLLALSAWVPSEHSRARLIAPDRVGAGVFDVVVEVSAEKDWHTYWVNPGDSGLATRVAWSLPAGISTAGELAFPPPMRVVEQGIGNYVHPDTVDLVAPFKAEGGSRGKITLAARVDWLVCRKVCLPGSAELSVKVSRAAESSPDPLIVSARAKLPRPPPFPARFALDGGQLLPDAPKL